MKNADLKAKYDAMHKQGSTSWTSTGWNERMLILSMMEGWEGLNVLEVGCGEGDLAAMMGMAGAQNVNAIDYSIEAIEKAQKKYNLNNVYHFDRAYKNLTEHSHYDIVVMQGVLEHLDKPYEELKWMIDNLLHDEGAIITTSPGFINMRGMWWIYEKYVHGVKVSLTDLHEIHPWEMEDFAQMNGLGIKRADTDYGWAWGVELVKDFTKRIPAACKDHNYTYSDIGFKKFMNWLAKAIEFSYTEERCVGATIGYKLWK